LSTDMSSGAEGTLSVPLGDY